MDILDVIKTRRSIRRYKTDPIDDKAVQKVLEAAHWAPSWGNTQCWRFIVVRTPEIKTKIADSLMKVKIENELVENAAAQSVKNAPVLIVLCAEMGKAGYSPDGEMATDKGDWFMFDIALAMENLVLAAHALGLGTVIVGGFDAVKVAEILQVPDDLKVVTMTPLGFPLHTGQVSPRRGLAEVVFNEKYGR